MAAVSAHGNARHADERLVASELTTFDQHASLEHDSMNMQDRFKFERQGWPGILLLLLMMPPVAARAHNGPPFPIIENKKVGPCIVSLWTHPDVGTGAFYVFVEPAPGGTVPDDLKIQIAVQPATGRLPEASYSAARVKSRDQVQYNAMADFDRQELWRVRLIVQSAQGSGEATTQVEVTPPGFGRWDLLLYLLPFLLVAFLWFRGIARVRRRRSELITQEAQAANTARVAGTANHAD